MFLVLLMQLLYGCTFTISKILIGFSSPIFVIGIRMVIAGAILCVLALLLKKRYRFNRLEWGYIFQISFFGIFLPYTLRYWSQQYLPVIKTAIIYNVAPFGAFLFSRLLLKERSSLRKWMGLCVGFCAIVPILIDDRHVGGNAFGFISWPELAMLGAVFSFSYSWVIMKKLVTRNRTSPIILNGISMLIGGVCALMSSFSLETNHTLSNPTQFFLWLALIIIITNMICYNLYAYLLTKHSATLLSLAGLMAPFSAGITSWLYFGEALTWKSAISATFVLVGFIIFYYEELRHAGQILIEDIEEE